MNYKMMEVKPTKVIGMVYRGSNVSGEIPAMWEVFNRRFTEIENANRSCFYGLCYDNDIKGSFSYLSGLSVEEITNIPNGMEAQEIPGGKYAVFTFKDHISKIGAFWNEIYRTYLPENNLQPIEGTTFEYYDDRFDKNGELDIYIPVK